MRPGSSALGDDLSESPNVTHRLQERVRWRRELERSVGDRDMLGTQLVRRNDELALLYEKLRLQEATIVQGRKAYG